MAAAGSEPDRLRRALSALESFRTRQRENRAEPAAEFLAAHESLRDVLEPLLGSLAFQPPPSIGPRHSEVLPNFLLPRPGQDFGPYRLEERLGQGSSGVVFLASDARLARKVALKLLHPELLADRRGRDRFWREARAASALDHPNICAIFEVGVVETVPFLAMRYIAGQTLAARVVQARDQGLRMLGLGGTRPGQHTSPSPAAKAKTPVTGTITPGSRSSIDALLLRFEQLAGALHYVHQQGLVHRDVKPANIMLGDGDEPVLLDFGLARTREHSSSIGTAADAGTPRYMAPEQIVGNRSPGPEADVYALGVTLYECATLRHPFEGSTQRELYDAILHRTPVAARQRNSRLPRDLQVVLQKAMEKDPARRYATAAAFGEDLRRVRTLLPIRARPTSRIVRAQRWLRRNPLAATFLVCVGATTIGLLSLLLQFLRDHRRLDLQATRALLEVAIREAADLYPAHPHKIAPMQQWLARFDDRDSLRTRREAVRAARTVLQEQARRLTAPEREADPRARGLREQIDSLRAELGQDQRPLIEFMQDTVRLARQVTGTLGPEPEKAKMIWFLQPFFDRRREEMAAELRNLEAVLPGVAEFAFADPARQREYDQLDELVTDLDAACAPAGLVARVRSDLEAAMRARDDAASAGDEWSRVAREVARDPIYRHLVLAPQDGLVPIGADPRTHLQQFWHPRSGTRPAATADGDLILDDGSGMVFVLLPAGTFRMGLEAPGYTQHEVGLVAFLLSKYEVTQGQWQRLGGGTPSTIQAVSTVSGRAISWKHPVENVSALEATRVLTLHGLLLPTEAQWEYACRAGTQTETWAGTTEQLADRVNVNLGRDDYAWIHAPVDFSQPNPWGFYNINGNVAEMCRDHNISYDVTTHAPGDGLLQSFLSFDWAIRGGSLADGFESFKSGKRLWHVCYVGFPTNGVRPAIAVRTGGPQR